MKQDAKARPWLGLSKRLSIIMYETVGVGAFLVVLALLEYSESGGNSVAMNFSWVFGAVGAVMILVGLELGSLLRLIPRESLST